MGHWLAPHSKNGTATQYWQAPGMCWWFTSKQITIRFRGG